MREAGFYTVAGIVIKTGMLSVAIQQLPELLENLLAFLKKVMPDAVTSAVSELYGIAKTAVLAVAGLFGAKIAYDTSKMFGGDTNKTAPSPTSDGGKAFSDSLKQRLDADLRVPVDGGGTSSLTDRLRLDSETSGRLDIGKVPLHIGGDTAGKVGGIANDAKINLESRPVTR